MKESNTLEASMTKKNILAICGSTRKASTNHRLIQAIRKLSASFFTISLIENLVEIPHFNPDIDTDNPPLPVIAFRKALHEADGILICTPEYAMGVPGTLKNAIDWTVSSCEFSHKPVALITASSLGEKSHASLLGTLRIIEANIPDSNQLIISYAKTKINSEGKITDQETLASVISVMDNLNQQMTATLLNPE